jgi:hypothetical protein
MSADGFTVFSCCFLKKMRNKFLLASVKSFTNCSCKSRDECSPRKLSKNCLTGFEQCAMVLSKRIYDSIFRKKISKVRNEFSPPTS